MAAVITPEQREPMYGGKSQGYQARDSNKGVFILEGTTLS